MLSEISEHLLYISSNICHSRGSFLSLHRIKTYLRNSTGHCGLSILFMLYVHTSKMDTLDLVTEFVSVNSQRMC